MTLSEKKQILRKRIRISEGELSERYLRQSEEKIISRLLASDMYRTAQNIFCFVSVKKEINTRAILTDALAMGKTVCVPLCRPGGVLECRQIHALTDLTPNAYGIPEPSEQNAHISPDETDLSIIPCLTCSHSGQRLGRGGGYYDRFLARYQGGAILLCRERLIRDEIPTGRLDQPIPWVLTDSGFFEDGIPERF